MLGTEGFPLEKKRLRGNTLAIPMHHKGRHTRLRLTRAKLGPAGLSYRHRLERDLNWCTENSVIGRAVTLDGF